MAERPSAQRPRDPQVTHWLLAQMSHRLNRSWLEEGRVEGTRYSLIQPTRTRYSLIQPTRTRYSPIQPTRTRYSLIQPTRQHLVSQPSGRQAHRHAGRKTGRQAGRQHAHMHVHARAHTHTTMRTHIRRHAGSSRRPPLSSPHPPGLELPLHIHASTQACRQTGRQ